jgi:hypothetical protein
MARADRVDRGQQQGGNEVARGVLNGRIREIIESADIAGSPHDVGQQ